MYLLVFSFLIIAMLGVYTQVFALQTARMLSGESGIAQMMMVWHQAAVSLATGCNVASATDCDVITKLSAVNCSLTSSGATACKRQPLASGGPANKRVYVTGGTYTGQSGATYPYLPAGYNTVTYKWNSLTFQSAAGSPYYVVTWAPPPANPADQITVPPVGISESDLYRQLQNAGVSLISYGTVKGNQLITAVPASGGSVTYPLPAGALADGSVAVISQP